MSYIINTDALARNQEGAIVVYPEREKDPITFYLKGEVKPSTAYTWEKVDGKNLTIFIHGMDTSLGKRDFYLKAKIESKESGVIKLVSIVVRKDGRNYEIQLVPDLLKDLWPGGPYTLIKTLSEIDKKFTDGREPWLEKYFFESGHMIEKRMSFPELFKKFNNIF